LSARTGSPAKGKSTAFTPTPGSGADEQTHRYNYLRIGSNESILGSGSNIILDDTSAHIHHVCEGYMHEQVIREYNSGSIMEIRVNPASSRRGMEGMRDERIVISVHSPPEKGKANKEALKVLAKALGVPPSSLELLKGRASRNKTVIVHGLTPSEILARLGST